MKEIYSKKIKEALSSDVFDGVFNAAMPSTGDSIPAPADGLYFDTYSQAVQYAGSQAQDRGFSIDEYSWDLEIAFGKGKPQPGETRRHTISLLKDGVESNKQLIISVYGMDSGKYELNYYIQ